MDYMQLTDAQLQEMRKSQLLQYEADFAQADIRRTVANAIIANPASSERDIEEANVQLANCDDTQLGLDTAHAALLAVYNDAAAALAAVAPAPPAE